MQMISWLVAGLVIVINGYLLVDFFSNEAKGVIFITGISIFTGAYVAFIVYLASRGITFASWWGPPKHVEAVE